MSEFKNPSAFSQAYPPASKFDPSRDMPSLTSKVAVVTGGYSGIGYETVKQLLLKDCTVYIFGRKQTLFDEAAQKLSSEGVAQRAKFVECDLSSYASIKASVAAFEQQEPSGKLHLLFNNGGVMVPPQPAWTQEGHELQFGTNVVGHWLLTRKLLPALEKASKEDGTKSRVVFTSSSAADVFSPKGGVDYDSLKKGPDGKNVSKMSNWGLYGQVRGDTLSNRNVCESIGGAHACIYLFCRARSATSLSPTSSSAVMAPTSCLRRATRAVSRRRIRGKVSPSGKQR